MRLHQIHASDSQTIGGLFAAVRGLFQLRGADVGTPLAERLLEHPAQTALIIDWAGELLRMGYGPNVKG